MSGDHYVDHEKEVAVWLMRDWPSFAFTRQSRFRAYACLIDPSNIFWDKATPADAVQKVVDRYPGVR